MQRGSFCINNKLLNSVPKTLAKIKLFGIIIDSLATVAQLVEQLIRNQQVAGSSPASSSKQAADASASAAFFIFCIPHKYLMV